MTVFIGVGLVAREIDRRSIFGLLAKPLPRWEFIVGKYVGLVLTVAVNIWAMAAALYLMLGMGHLVDAGESAAGLGRAGARSAPAASGRAHHRRAGAAHGGRAVLLDVLVERADLRRLHGRLLRDGPGQRRPARLRRHRRRARRWCRRSCRPSAGSCRRSPRSTSRTTSSTGTWSSIGLVLVDAACMPWSTSATLVAARGRACSRAGSSNDRTRCAACTPLARVIAGSGARRRRAARARRRGIRSPICRRNACCTCSRARRPIG